MKRILLFIYLIASFCLKAQESPHSFQLAEKQARTIKNEGNLLPLANLDQYTFYYHNFNLTNNNEFVEKIQQYIPFGLWEKTKGNNFSNNRILVCTIAAQNINTSTINEMLQWLTYTDRLILCVMGKQEIIIPDLLLQRADAVLYYPSAKANAQSILAQIIFGGRSFQKDVLPLRLGYAPPQTVGMDSLKLAYPISAIIQEGLIEEAFPGAQVLVVKDGQVVFHETYGYHTYDKKRKVQKNDIYDLASITKIMGPLPALMKLHGEGKFGLDDTVGQYLLKAQKSNKADLKWRDILAHQAGLKAWIPFWKETLKSDGKFKRRTFKPLQSNRYPIYVTDNLFLHKSYKKRKIDKAILASPVDKNPSYRYSGLSFYWYPEIIENLTNQDYETYLRENIYRKIGAYTLNYNSFLYHNLDQIVPTERDTFFRMQQLHGTVHDEGAAMMGGISGNAGLFSNINDLAKMAYLYQQKGKYGKEQILPAKSVEEFTQCQFCEEGNRRGLGFDKPLIDYVAGKAHTAKDASPNSYGHSGYTGTFVWIDPDASLIYIFFSNRVFPTRDNRKLYELDIRPRIHQAIYNAIIK